MMFEKSRQHPCISCLLAYSVKICWHGYVIVIVIAIGIGIDIGTSNAVVDCVDISIVSWRCIKF